MNKLMKIHPADNVLIVRIPLQENEIITINGHSYTVGKALAFGHKIAAFTLQPGEKVIKFGVPIGSVTAPVAVGEHIHLHNLKSDYLPTYTQHHEFIRKS